MRRDWEGDLEVGKGMRGAFLPRPGLSAMAVAVYLRDPKKRGCRRPRSVFSTHSPFDTHIISPNMKLFAVLVFGSLVPNALSFSYALAYERLWIWGLYETDESGRRVAPGCTGSAGLGRCTFVELMEYITELPARHVLEARRSLMSSVDPSNIPAAVSNLQ